MTNTNNIENKLLGLYFILAAGLFSYASLGIVYIIIIYSVGGVKADSFIVLLPYLALAIVSINSFLAIWGNWKIGQKLASFVPLTLIQVLVYDTFKHVDHMSLMFWGLNLLIITASIWTVLKLKKNLTIAWIVIVTLTSTLAAVLITTR